MGKRCDLNDFEKDHQLDHLWVRKVPDPATQLASVSWLSTCSGFYFTRCFFPILLGFVCLDFLFGCFFIFVCLLVCFFVVGLVWFDLICFFLPFVAKLRPSSGFDSSFF